MNRVVIHHDIDTPHPTLGVCAIQQGQQVTKSPIIFTGAEAMEYRAGREIERASEIVFFILPWRHDFLLALFGHPRRADFGQQMDIEFIRKHHHLTRVQLLRMEANAGQALDPLGVVIKFAPMGYAPPVSIIKPTHGIDALATDNFRSFCEQEYPNVYELLFCVEEPDDPAVPLIQDLGECISDYADVWTARPIRLEVRCWQPAR